MKKILCILLILACISLLKFNKPIVNASQASPKTKIMSIYYGTTNNLLQETKHV